ncbi:MAG: nucleoside kinase [Anaerolineae bacterium]
MSRQPDTSQIKPAKARRTVQIQFDDGQIWEGPKGTTLEAFARLAADPSGPPVIACVVNGQLRELTYHAYTDLNVRLITLAESDGMRIYRRSLALLLVAAAEELFPTARIVIDYGLNFGGLYFEVEGHPPFTAGECQRLEAHMRRMVEADLPIHKERVPLDEVQALFEAKGWHDKLRLLPSRRKEYLTLYTLGQTRDYLHGYMVPSSGYLQKFAVRPYGDGTVLQYPRPSQPDVIQEPRDYPKLVAVYNEYGEWMKTLGVRDVGRLNEQLRQGQMRQVILVSEALHEKRVANIAEEIVSRRDTVRLVMISGPSSSGKTTFSKRLAIQLRAQGMLPVAIPLDDFIVERSKTPLDEEGDYDYESLYSLDLELFNKVLVGLMDGETVTMPGYNFISGQREWREPLTISNDHIIIVEGIHGLNPELVPHIPLERIFRVYVSALTQLNIDHHNRVPTTDTRLIRRIIRDAAQRGYTAQETISRWPKVRRGEHKWIFPFQENADVMFNSALVYELAVLKPLVEPLLLEVKPGSVPHLEAKRVLSFLQWFEPCPADLIPDNSILREFIGGSILQDYTP